VASSEQRQRRIYRALDENMQQWIDALTDIESNAIPGNKARILHLQRNMMQAHRAIRRLMQELDEPDV
jgi:hypothetical protein